MKTFVASPANLLLVVAFAALLIAGLFWQNLMFAGAVGSSESRPTLLRDAEWGTPAPSFRERFSDGTNVADLLKWLSESGFTLDGNNAASLRIRGMPCNESVEVSWTAEDGIIRESSAVVREAGCL